MGISESKSLIKCSYNKLVNPSLKFREVGPNSSIRTPFSTCNQIIKCGNKPIEWMPTNRDFVKF